MLKLRTHVAQFNNPSKIIHGPNSMVALKGLQSVRVVVLISKSIHSNKTKIDYIRQNINCHEIEFIVKPWAAEPEIKDVKIALRKLQEFKPDWIIAIGGGSLIDGAKILWSFYEHPQLEEALIHNLFKIPELRGKSKFIAVPTTIGTGSEVSSSAVLFDSESGKKIPIVTNDFLPDIVVLDSLLVTGIPKNIIISTVIDACSHSIEGYVSKINNRLLDCFALSSLGIIFNNMQGIIENPEDENILNDLQYAAMMAGWVQNHCLVGLAHALAHQMGGFKISHGIANCIFLNESILFNSKEKNVLSRYNEITEYCNFSGGITELVKIILDFTNSGEFSLNLSSYGIVEGNFDDIIDGALTDVGARYNPVDLDKDDLRKILLKTL